MAKYVIMTYQAPQYIWSSWKLHAIVNFLNREQFMTCPKDFGLANKFEQDYRSRSVKMFFNRIKYLELRKLIFDVSCY